MANKVVQLKDKQGNNLYPVPADGGDVSINPYIPGCILACATNNKGHNGWNFTDAAEYSDGTWLQYGPMKNPNNNWQMQIVVPQGEHWVVYVEFNVPTIGVANSSSWQSYSIRHDATTQKYYATSIFQDGAQASSYSGQTNGEVFVLEPGTHRFCLNVVTNDAGCNVYGSGNGTSVTDTWEHGPAMTYTCYLVERCTDQEYYKRSAIYEQ